MTEHSPYGKQTLNAHRAAEDFRNAFGLHENEGNESETTGLWSGGDPRIVTLRRERDELQELVRQLQERSQ